MVSLYRKWRSRSFEDLFGQDHVVRTLRNAVRQKRVSHAYLFTGPRGTGKTSTARILAKAINCRHPVDGNPCNTCEPCVAGNEGRALDVIEIDAASNTSVENVRELRERVGYVPSEGSFKVYIVDEVHRLSGAAFDAFLKTLEEPPPHVVFVFASTEPHKVPETISSRCQRFDFHRISRVVTLARVKHVAAEEGIQIDDAALQLVALHAQGSLRDALGLLEQVTSYTDHKVEDSDVREALGLADATTVSRLTNALLSRDVGAGLSLIQQFMDDGGDSRQVLMQLVDYWRALLIATSGVPVAEVVVDPALFEQLQGHAANLSPSRVLAVIRALTEQEFSPRFAVPPALVLEMGFVQAALSLKSDLRERAEPQAPAPPPVNSPSPAKEKPAQDPKPRAVQETSPAPTALHELEPMTPRASTGPATIESQWPVIIATMRARSPSLQAVLRSGYPLRTMDDEITIGFEWSFHVTQLSDVKKRRMLEEVVREVVGASFRVKCVHASKEEIESVKVAAGAEQDDGFVEEVTERLREFHEKQLGNGHS